MKKKMKIKKNENKENENKENEIKDDDKFRTLKSPYLLEYCKSEEQKENLKKIYNNTNNLKEREYKERNTKITFAKSEYNHDLGEFEIYHLIKDEKKKKNNSNFKWKNKK